MLIVVHGIVENEKGMRSSIGMRSFHESEEAMQHVAEAISAFVTSAETRGETVLTRNASVFDDSLELIAIV